MPKVWGGRKLACEWGYAIPEGPVGECWAVSAHPHGDCRVARGAFAGLRLSELWERERPLFGAVPAEVLTASGGGFPLLVKILDVHDALSVQVHPGDAYARAHEGGQSGKLECWYVLSAEPGACIVVGQRAHDRAEFLQMVGAGRWDELLNEVPVRAGDFFQIDPGTVHAIVMGVTILETQQSSDLTYRVYDYDRPGADGRPRELHLQKALDVIDFSAPCPACGARPVDALAPDASGIVRIGACSRFVVELARVAGAAGEAAAAAGAGGSDTGAGVGASGGAALALALPMLPTFRCASVVTGAGAVAGEPVHKGDHFIIPAGSGPIELTGHMDIVLSRAPLETEMDCWR